ncbi:MAG: GTPase-associated system all-helical protein GASH [Agrobacterium cavarae]|uniref:GTPase-associated system all-helical protein GASH n=1 Tax=Agrobacterium cavarae TaxID=2528239 RepID=UPI0031B1C418
MAHINRKARATLRGKRIIIRGVLKLSDVLLRFLGHGLVDVGGDDAKLEKLSATSSDLASLLKKTPQKAMAYSLVAFDPSAPVDDPVVTDARDALAQRWPTYINTFAGVPIAVIRAMLLQALSIAAKQDERVAVAFVSSARNALQFIEAGHERSIWIDVVTLIEAQVDAKAEAEWATPDGISVEPMAFSAPGLEPPRARYSKVSRESFTKKYARRFWPAVSG